MPSNSGYKFPILNSDGTPSTTVVDMGDMFVRKELFLDAGLWGWGRGQLGMIGDGTTSDRYSPIQIGSLTNWKQVACNAFYSIACKTDGTLWTWGYNGYGALGDGTTTNQPSPIQVGTMSNWKQVACGYYGATAIKTDGTLWTWGYNAQGQLGNGTSGINYSSPIQVGSLTNWKQVSARGYHTAAIKTDGTLWTWGSNTSGQLGNGNQINYSSPIQVGSLTNWKQVFCGVSQTFAIKNNNALWAWGYNNAGQLGNGTIDPYSSPIQVGTLTNWKQVSIYNFQFSAIKTDGTLWTCGDDGYSGSLGNGASGIKYSSPIQIGSLTNWKQVALGYRTLVSVKTDGTLWACGYNNQGQLGNGLSGAGNNYSSPIQIGSLTNWKHVGVDRQVIAIQSPDLP